MDLELTRGPSRAGRLTGPDGLPVVGADAYGLSARDWSGTGRSRALDADTFEVGGLEPGHPRLLVFTHKARKLVGAAVLKDEDLKSTAPLEVKLVPAGAITGRLLDDDGLPWAGATLSVWMSDPDRPQDGLRMCLRRGRSPPTPRVASGSKRSCRALRPRLRSQTRIAVRPTRRRQCPPEARPETGRGP